MTPNARKDGLLVQKVGDETIIYDQQRNHAHRLNRTAALVWHACNGQRTVADLTQELRQQIGSTADEDLVLLALERLDKGHLLREPLALPREAKTVTRRDALRRLALVGGMALMIPVVQSMVAPTPAMAASLPCASHNQTPTGLRPCCPGTQLVAGRCIGHT